MRELSVADIRARLKAADAEELAVMQRALVADSRKGVRAALAAAEKRVAAEAAEAERVAGLYSFERNAAAERAAREGDSLIILGMDEVGRGPIAGPLAAGGVVFRADAELVVGLNDSKQVKPEKRIELARVIKDRALAWAVEMVEPSFIDAHGMSASLREAFGRVIASVEAQGVVPDVILLDGNPLHLDSRELSVVKGDGKCASIAAASIIAKVERDGLMASYDEVFPGYDFASHKGYGSASHIAALNELGLSPIHRKTFCTGLLQETLF